MAYWKLDSTDTSGALRGRPLRYLLVQVLYRRSLEARRNPPLSRAMTTRELVAACEAAGVVFDDRPSKIVSDALRWEHDRGRLRRVDRSLYLFVDAPRTTLLRINKNADQIRSHLRSAAEARSMQGERPARPRSEHLSPAEQGRSRSGGEGTAQHDVST